jgi:hypothetical protein
MRPFIVSILPLAAFFVLLPSAALASTTFTYTDTPISISFVFNGPTLTSLAPGTDITGEITGFSMTYPAPSEDNAAFALGVNNIVDGSEDVQIGTDGSGSITSWTVTATLFASYPAFSGENPTDFYCNFSVSATSSGNSGTLSQDNDAGFCPGGTPGVEGIGTWSAQSQGSVPEPQTTVLLASGLAGLIFLASLRKRKLL